MTPTPTSPQPGTGEAFEAGVRAGLEAAARACDTYASGLLDARKAHAMEGDSIIGWNRLDAAHDQSVECAETIRAMDPAALKENP